MLKWLLSILNSFVVVNGETTVTLGHEGMLIASQLPINDDNGAFVVPASAL
jgi:hypothetical protein